MAELLQHPIAGPSVWKGEQMAARPDWICHFNDAELAEIDAAVRTVKRAGTELFQIGEDDFPLPILASRLRQIRSEVGAGRGFAVLRGLPISNYSLDDARILFWGLISHLGKAEGQDRKGSLMHQVTDTGKTVENSDSTRGYETNNELMFHNDGGDAFALLCVRPAKTGGNSRLMSAGALFNEILARRPDLAQVAQEPFHFDSRAQNPADVKVQVVPIFNFHDGHLNVLQKRRYIETAQRFDEVPRLTTLQLEALDLIDEICDDPAWHLSFDMQAGDIQIGNNFALLHSRTKYQDVDDPAMHRLLLRIWMTLPNGRALPPVFAHTREFGQTYRRRQDEKQAETA